MKLAPFFLIIICLSAEACKKTWSGKCDAFCKDSDIESVTNIYPRYSFASFKRNSNTEFVCFRYATSDSMTLLHFDLNTNISKVLVAGKIIVGKPSYSESGWIFFSSTDAKIHKVFEDGTGYQRITNKYTNFYPSLDPSDTKFICSREVSFSQGDLIHHPDLPKLIKMEILDFDGNLVDSICVPNQDLCQAWQYSDWTAYGILNLSGTWEEYGLYLCNPTDGSNREVFRLKSKDIGNLYDHELSNDGSYALLSTPFGIEKLILENKGRQTFLRSRDCSHYEGVSFSGDGNLILTTELHYESESGCSTLCTSSIVLVDSKGDLMKTIIEGGL